VGGDLFKLGGTVANNFFWKEVSTVLGSREGGMEPLRCVRIALQEV